MRHSVEDIQQNPDFQLLDKLSYDHILDFALDYLKKPTKSMTFYFLFLLILILVLTISVILGIIVKDRTFIRLLQQYFYGLVISFTIIIPIHEAIHGIVYFLLGARKISFGAELKQFAFYAVADRFVTPRNGFYILALAPFLIVSLLNLAGFIFVHGYAGYTYISVLFFHTTMCAGDFALLSYYEFHKDKDIYTFDDVKNRTSYFYYKKPEVFDPTV